VLAVLGWLATAAAAITAGVFAVGAIGHGIAGSTTSPLSDQAVAKALAKATRTSAAAPATSPNTSPTTSRPSAPRGTTPEPRPQTKVRQVRGGTVVVRCAGGQATLESWSPDQGYEADDVHRGPDSKVRVKFKSGRSELETEIGCRGDVPVILRERADDH
jgi:hypothetical protein